VQRVQPLVAQHAGRAVGARDRSDCTHVKRTAGIFAVILAGCVLLALPAYVGPAFLEEPSSFFVLVPLLSVYFFHHIGIPGLLEHGGACGWGWCSPTAFGWIFLAAFWLGLIWLVAAGIARLLARFSSK